MVPMRFKKMEASMKTSNYVPAIGSCLGVAQFLSLLTAFAQVEITNLQIAGVAENSLKIGSMATFLASESEQGADFNGDGDLDDSVLQLYHMADDTVFNTALSA